MQIACCGDQENMTTPRLIPFYDSHEGGVRDTNTNRRTTATGTVLCEKTQCIEEGSIQKTRQTVVVLDWGARSNAALGIFGVKVYSIVYIAVVQFSFTFVGVMFYVDLYFKFLIHI